MKKSDKTKVKTKDVQSSMSQDPMHKHIVDTLNKYEDGPDIVEQVIRNSPTPVKGYVGGSSPTEQELEDFKAPIKKDDPMATWVKNNNANNKNPGTFKKLVEEDEKAYREMQLKLPAETKDKYGYTPSQNRQIDAYLTRNKDITKRTAPAKPSPAVREQSPFIKHRQKLGDVMRNQKDKKVVLLNKPTPLNINYHLDTYDQLAVDLDVKEKKEKLDRVRKEVDPDLFKGLGIFFGKKF
jgi:hypothetical protein